MEARKDRWPGPVRRGIKRIATGPGLVEWVSPTQLGPWSDFENRMPQKSNPKPFLVLVGPRDYYMLQVLRRPKQEKAKVVIYFGWCRTENQGGIARLPGLLTARSLRPSTYA